MTSEGRELRSYAVVTAAYWAFTLSDGALRMLVLGHFHKLGYTPFQLALLFLLYELCGVITNFLGGWLGTRTGLRFTLVLGMGLQVAALLMLSGLSTQWPHSQQLVYVIVAQGISGIAKDFTKISAKSSIKLLVPAHASSTLFRWVALLTGSKNTLKGIGFFVGGLLLSSVGFQVALWLMAAAIVCTGLLAGALLPKKMGQSSKFKIQDAWKSNRTIKILSLARLFLFCARDVWFVVGLPVFLSEALGWNFLRIGMYLALWVIGYGIVQALTPKFLRQLGRGEFNDARSAQRWGGILSLTPLAILVLLQLNVKAEAAVLGGLALFGILFAINSAIHSYLVLAYSDVEKVSMNVGFYYMANAMGRLVGTLLSGLLYQLAGLQACLLVASAMLILSTLLAMALPDTRKLALTAPPGPR